MIADGGDGTLTGVCLAVLARPGDWWRDKAAAALAPDVAGRWLGDSCSAANTGWPFPGAEYPP